jgi:hypothetical protein
MSGGGNYSDSTRLEALRIFPQSPYNHEEAVIRAHGRRIFSKKTTKFYRGIAILLDGQHLKSSRNCINKINRITK